MAEHLPNPLVGHRFAAQRRHDVFTDPTDDVITLGGIGSPHDLVEIPEIPAYRRMGKCGNRLRNRGGHFCCPFRTASTLRLNFGHTCSNSASAAVPSSARL